MKSLLAFLLVVCGAAGQTLPEFEAVSVKPAAPLEPGTPAGGRGGPGSTSPGQINYRNINFTTLLRQAFGVRPFQIVAPAWMNTERYDIVAKLPPGTTNEQLSLMLRKVLAERFALVTHHETREVPVYEMQVGKNGPKFHESPAVPPEEPPVAGPPGQVGKMGPDGFMVLPGRQPVMQTTSDGRIKLNVRRETMETFAQMLEMLDRPRDECHRAEGHLRFQHCVFHAAARCRRSVRSGEHRTAPPSSKPCRVNWGLKLESKKAPADMLVVDSAKKVPIEN